MKKCPFCAEDIQDQAIKCRYCHQDLSHKDRPGKGGEAHTDAGGCPKCGGAVNEKDDGSGVCSKCGEELVVAPQKIGGAPGESRQVMTGAKFLKRALFVIVGLPVLIFLIGIVKGFTDYWAQVRSHELGAASFRTQAARSMDAVAQLEYETARQKFYLSYERQPNEIKKSSVFNQARELDERNLNGKTFVNWRGTLEEIITPKGGETATFIVRSYRENPEGVNGSFVASYHGVVNNESEIYKELSELHPSPKTGVLFSGTFPDAEERSVTEWGAMNAPEFRIELTSIKKQ